MGFEAGRWVDRVAEQYLVEVVSYCFCILSEIRKVISAISEDGRVVLKV